MPVDFMRQGNLTDGGSIPRENLQRSVVGMAHFAGTGPASRQCQHCLFWTIPPGRKKPICDKFRSMTGDSGKSIPGATPSCRYFQQRGSA